MSVVRREIAAEDAAKLTMAAVEHATQNSWDITVAVCDPHGSLVAFRRTDGVMLPAVEFAIDKAFTAATLRKPSGDFGDYMASSATLSLGLGSRDRLIAWAGGLPIFDGGICIGGIGVSGAEDFEDVACGKAALASLGLSSEA
jgi:uncharacterized protein GlcG (DUF336 family)